MESNHCDHRAPRATMMWEQFGGSQSSSSSPPTMEVPLVTGTKVGLSFEPELADDIDLLQEIFIVFYNTVVWEYRHRHEEGTLSDLALNWLVEAAGDALDRANREVNAKCVADFVSSGTMAMIPELKEALAADEAGIFEPVVVEYLKLESYCQRDSTWDKYPISWPGSRFIHSFGYYRARTKVEALYAYVECHQKVMLKFGGVLERFAGLTKCMRESLDAAMYDLGCVDDLNPRRFYYSKHELALKTVLSIRMRSLQECSEEGWLSSLDAEGLVECLRERLAEVEQHKPRLRTRQHTDGESTEDAEARMILARGVSFAWVERFRVSVARGSLASTGSRSGSMRGSRSNSMRLPQIVSNVSGKFNIAEKDTSERPFARFLGGWLQPKRSVGSLGSETAFASAGLPVTPITPMSASRVNSQIHIDDLGEAPTLPT